MGKAKRALDDILGAANKTRGHGAEPVIGPATSGRDRWRGARRERTIDFYSLVCNLAKENKGGTIMFKLPLLSGLAFIFCVQGADAACAPSSPKPTNEELANLVICLQGEIDKSVNKGDLVALRFPDQGWCIARGDPGDNRALTLQCAPGAPGQGGAHMTIDAAK